MKKSDIHITGCALYFLPVNTRVPLKFGTEVTTYVTCARVWVQVTDTQGQTAEGWGETPLSVQWVWPSKLGYEPRHAAMKKFCVRLAEAMPGFASVGHPMEVGYDLQEHLLPKLMK